MTMLATLEGPEHPPPADPRRRRPRALRAGRLAAGTGARRRPAPGAPALVAVRPGRARPRGLPRRRRGAPRLGALRVPLPVPRRRREHRQRLGDLEHERRVRHAGTSRTRADHGIVPVFPYYSCSSRARPPAATKQAKDLSNLANPATMAAYYARPARCSSQRAAGVDSPWSCTSSPTCGATSSRRAADDDATHGAGVRGSSSGDAGARRPAEHRRRVRPGDRPAARPARARTCCSPTTCRCGARTRTSRTRTSPDAAGRQPGGPRRRRFYRSLGARASTSRSPTSPTATPAFKQIEYGDGGASRWDDADFVALRAVHRRASSPAPASASSSGRSRSATRRCAR